jgi:hypothetical protein
VASADTPRNIPDKEAPSERDQWIDAVARLIELTQNGQMEWSVGERTTPGEGRLTTPPYYATYKKHTYKLEERWVEAIPPSPMQQLLRYFATVSERDRHVVKLDVVDAQGRSLYSVPHVGPLWDLLDVVQKQTAGDEALHDLLE